MSWEKVKLIDCCVSIADGDHQPPPKSETGIPFVTIANIVNNQFDFTNSMFVPNYYYEKLDSKRKAQKGDILYSVVGSFGIPVFIKDNKPFVFQRHIAILRPNGNIDARFLYYTMLSRDFYMKADAAAIGAAQRTVSLTALRNIEITVPPIETQRRIADILSAYDDLIENNRKQIKLLEEAAQRLYKEWFVDLRFPGHEHTKIVDGVPEGWKKRLLGDIVEVKYGKDHKSISDGLIPVYGSGGFMRKCGQVLYDGESVLIPRKGSLNNIIYVEEAFWTVDTMFYTKMKMPNIGVFLYFFVKSFDMYSMNIGAAVPSMTTNILNALDIIVPSSNILEHFQSTTKMHFRKMELLQKQIETAMQARDRLLPKLMSGEVEMQL